VLDKVTIAYRGARYEIGRGRDYFGLWTVDAPRSQPLEWWPETQEGWSSAWARFCALETPDTIAPAGRGATQAAQAAPAWAGPVAVASGPGRGLAVGLLVAGLALGTAGLFPDYLNGSSLAAQSFNLVAHLIYLIGWAAAAVLIALGGARLRIGALLAAGLSIVTFGFFLADAGTPISGGAHLAGAGLWLSLIGWVACAAGSAVAVAARPATRAGTPAPGRLLPLGRPRGTGIGTAVLLILAGLGTAATFAPAWDSFTLRAASGQTQTLTAGNAFAAPGAVIAGNVAVMVALAAVVIAAAMWRPTRHGAVLLAGAVIPMAAQAISAIIQVGQPVSPTQFGFSPAEASQLGLTVSAGLTPWFWIYVVLVVALLVSFAWMLFTPQDVAVAPDAGTVPGARPGAGTVPGARPGDGPGTEYPTWHVAQAAAYGPVTGPADEIRAGGFDDGELDDGGFGAGSGDGPGAGSARRD
jgi:hypothetical protein